MDTKRKLRPESLALGRQAFRSGLKRVPALDADMRQHMERIGSDLAPELTAWLSGWDAENLKPAEIVGVV